MLRAISDPEENNDACMCALNAAGIYAIIELGADFPTCAITRDKTPLWYPTELKVRGQAIINEFSKYNNTIAFSTGNEVNQFAPGNQPEWNAPFQKKLLRDMKEYIDKCTNLRNVPIGFA